MLLVGWSSLPQSHLFAVLVHSPQEVNGTLASVALWDGRSLGILWQIIILLPLVQVMLKLVVAQGESSVTIHTEICLFDVVHGNIINILIEIIHDISESLIHL